MANKILVQGIEINYRKINENDYISLIDIAKNKNLSAPADVVKNWMRTRSALEYMCIWEKFYNPEIKEVEIDHFISETGSNSFTMSPTKWTESTNAIGIISKLGRNGGFMLIRILHLSLRVGFLRNSNFILYKNSNV